MSIVNPVLKSSLVALCALAGCATGSSGITTELRVAGSDTMLVLNRRLAEAFMRSNPGVSIRVEGGGSAAGVQALVQGEAEIAAVSRPLLPDEVEAIHERYATLGVRFLVAGDALSVYLNEANGVESLTVDQLRRIFDGSVHSWSDIGVDGGRVVVVVRPPGSGSYRFFRDRVLKGGSYAGDARTVPSTRDVLEVVQAEKGAIGYGGVAYRLAGVRNVLVDGVDPSQAGREENRYPLSRHLVYVTARPPTGLAKRFIDWSLAADGQAIVEEVGFIPLWSD